MGASIPRAVTADADGVERRLALVWNADGMQYWGLDASAGASADNGRIRFGVIDGLGLGFTTGLINGTHQTFKDDPVFSRIAAVRTCSSSSCLSGFSGSSASSHGTVVSSVLLGDFEDGQSPAYTTPASRQVRGGAAPEGSLYYYSVATNAEIARSINDAVAYGVDIINISMSPNGTYCSNESHSGVMEAVRAAENAGVLTVVTAGNDHEDLGSDECSVSDFAAYPDTIAVGALDDVVNLYSLATVGTPGYTGRTLINQTTTVGNGDQLWTRMVDIAVTGQVELTAGSGSSGDFVPARGTSYAAPQVAGAAGILKHWLSTSPYAYLRSDAYFMRAWLMGSGDGAYPTTTNGSTVALDRARGFGNLRAGAYPWFYTGYQKPLPHTLQTGDVIELPVGPDAGPESTAITGWKFVAVMDYNTYSTSPSMTFQLIDKCPAGGGQTVLLTSSKSTHVARLRMTPSTMATHFHNRCLWVRGTVHYAGAAFPMWTFENGYQGTRLYHDM